MSPCTHTQSVFPLTTLRWYSTQPHNETQWNKSPTQIMYKGPKANIHIHPKTIIVRGWGQTHAHIEAETLSRVQDNNHCVRGWRRCCNTVYSNTVYSSSTLFTRQLRARGLWEILGDPTCSGDLSLKLNRQQQKRPRASLLNYITVVH